MYDKKKVGAIQWHQPPTPGNPTAVAPMTFNLVYQEYADQWEENYACYKGMAAVLRANLVGAHPRETPDNWEYRKAQMCSPNYTKAIVDAYCAHLARKQGLVFPGSLDNNGSFKLFLDDADYNNTPFLDIFREQTALSSVFGGIGYLVDMPAFDITENMSNKDAIKNKVYPYVSVYYPPNILDWQYIRDQWGRPVLVYIKLLDDDGFIHCWWDLGDSIHWETYQSNVAVLTTSVGENSSFNLQRVMTELPKKVSEGGTDRIKYIPFEFQYNRKTGIKMIGDSDVSDIARLDVRFINNLSRIGEIADIAAFPILLLPRVRSGEAPAQQPVGPTSTLPKGPEPQDTPEWLAAEVAEPIRALWEDNDKIREEIYRVSLFGGMDQMNGGNNTGPALNIKYQQLGARLVEKVKGQQAAANGVLYHWQSWLGLEIDEQARVQMPQDYNIEDLGADIDQAVKSTDFVQSDAFRREMRRTIVNKMLPNLPIEVQEEIDKEVEDEFEIEEQEVEPVEGVADNAPEQGAQEEPNDTEKK